jgi:glycine oxidase
MAKTIGIVGAGLMGRMLGVELGQRGWEVTLFDKDVENVVGSCSWASAGMIAPSCELESAERDIAVLGSAALARWPAFAKQLDGPVDFRMEGSIVVAHPSDRHELERLKNKVLGGSPNPEFMRELTGAEIHEREPELSAQFTDGLYMSYEGQVDNRLVLATLADTLRNLGARFHFETEVTDMEPGKVHVAGETHTFDWVADCRGMGAKEELTDLRGIRGELIYVSAPEVTLHRPVRLMHPRYPIYIVPRHDHVYVIGATAIESEDYSPISVRSTMELLSAAYTVHTGFAEARVLETLTSCRPAFPNNRPRIIADRGLMRINGLYRHGFLISPMLSLFAAEYLDHGKVMPEAERVITEPSA